jgi:hypothetical protein
MGRKVERLWSAEFSLAAARWYIGKKYMLDPRVIQREPDSKSPHQYHLSLISAHPQHIPLHAQSHPPSHLIRNPLKYS